MFIKELFLGLKTYKQASRLLFSKQLWWFLLFPLVIYLLLFTGGSILSTQLLDPFRQWLFDLLKVEQFDQEKFAWLIKFMNGLLWIAFKIIFFIVFAIFSGYLVMILMAPVYALLSEKTEKLITNKDYPFYFKQFFKDIYRGIALAVRNMIYETGFVILFLVLGFIPVIGWLTSTFLFFISAYFYGFSFMDYSMERRRLGVKKSVHYVRKHKGLAFGNGLLFALLLFIPKIGILLASFTSLISVIAATLAIEKIEASQTTPTIHNS